MKNVLCKILMCVSLIAYGENISAQGFLKGLLKKEILRKKPQNRLVQTQHKQKVKLMLKISLHILLRKHMCLMKITNV